MKILTFKYKDGAVLSQEWDIVYDGEWPYGEEDEKVFYRDFNFFSEDNSQIDQN